MSWLFDSDKEILPNENNIVPTNSSEEFPWKAQVEIYVPAKILLIIWGNISPQKTDSGEFLKWFSEAFKFDS